VSTTPGGGEALQSIAIGSYSLDRPIWLRALRWLGRFYRSKRAGAAGLTVTMAIIIIGIIGPSVVPYGKDDVFSEPNPKYDINSFEPDALSTTIFARLSGPSRDHLFGTDDKGRDLFTRVILGARLSLQVGLAASALATIFGSIIGLTSGYFGGLFDLVVQRLVDAMIAIPSLVLLLLLVQVAEPSLKITILALTVLGTFGASRVIRAATLAVRNDVYIEAARVVGASPFRVIFRHVLPNITAPIIIIFTISIGGNILAESGLAFLNLGVQGPSWGSMVNVGRQFLDKKPAMSLIAGGAITLTVLAFNLLGDALRDVFDPRQRGSR
jgi:peptide/nickel transport system permease protein